MLNKKIKQLNYVNKKTALSAVFLLTYQTKTIMNIANQVAKRNA